MCKRVEVVLVREPVFHAGEDDSLEYKPPPSEFRILPSSLIQTSPFFALVFGVCILFFVMILVQICKLFGISQDSVGIISLLVPVPIGSLISSSNFRVKEHGQGQSSSGSAGGSRAGNAGGNRGTGGGENGRTGLAMYNVGGGGRRRANNGGDEENNGGGMGGNEAPRRNPSWWEKAVMLFTIIMELIQGILNFCGAELLPTATPGSVMGFFPTIISLLALVFYEVVRRQPYSNPHVATILNPRIIGILSRTGSALAVIGFISRMAIYLPLHLSWIFILAFLALLIIFVVDIL